DSVRVRAVGGDVLAVVDGHEAAVAGRATAASYGDESARVTAVADRLGDDTLGVEAIGLDVCEAAGVIVDRHGAAMAPDGASCADGEEAAGTATGAATAADRLGEDAVRAPIVGLDCGVVG